MPEKIFEAKGEIVASGLHPGMPNQQIPLWERGSNILFRDNSVKVGPAQKPLITKLNNDRVTGVHAVNNSQAGSDNLPSLVWGDNGNLFKSVLPPLPELVGSGYNGTNSNLWTIVSYGLSVFATNGIDPVQYMDNINTGSFVDIDTVSDLLGTFRCEHLAVVGPFVIAFNTNNTSEEVRWSDEDNPLVWTPDSQNKARDIQVRDLGSDIVSVVEYGNALALYGRDKVHLLRFVGSPFYFAAPYLIEGFGISSKHAITAAGRVHYGFGPNGIFATDGSTFAYIDDPAIHRHVYEDTLDLDKIEEVVAWYDPNETEVYFSYPDLESESGQTVSYNTQGRTWSMHAWHRTAAASGGLFDSPIVGGLDGDVWIQGPTSVPLASDANPVGISDVSDFVLGYGLGGYGQGGYGGVWSVD